MRNVLSVLLIMAFFNACDSNKTIRVQGNGVLDSETILLSNYYSVKSSGEYNLTLIQDSIWEIHVEGESNILPLIDIYISNGELIIENKNNYQFDLNEPINVIIHHEGLTSANLSGKGKIDLTTLISPSNFSSSISGEGNLLGEVKAGEIDFSVSGTGNVNTQVYCQDIEVSISGIGDFILAGEANDGIFNISGSGTIQAYNLPLKRCYTTISGIGSNYYTVSELLDVRISGIGNIYYKGDPEIVKNISGTGLIEKVD